MPGLWRETERGFLIERNLLPKVADGVGGVLGMLWSPVSEECCFAAWSENYGFKSVNERSHSAPSP